MLHNYSSGFLHNDSECMLLRRWDQTVIVHCGKGIILGMFEA